VVYDSGSFPEKSIFSPRGTSWNFDLFDSSGVFEDGVEGAKLVQEHRGCLGARHPENHLFLIFASSIYYQQCSGASLGVFLIAEIPNSKVNH